MTVTTAYLRRGGALVAGVTFGGYLVDYLFNLGLARMLSPHDYGDFRVAASFCYFFGLAVLLGGDRAAPRILAPCLEAGAKRRVWEYLRFYMRNACLLGLGLTVVTWVVSYLHVGSGDPHRHHPLAWVVLAVPLNAFAAMVSRTVQSARRPAQAILPWRIGLPVLQLAFFAAWVLWRGELAVIEALLMSILATAAITIGQWQWTRRQGMVEVARDEAFGDPRGWLAGSLPMMGSFLVALALAQDDLYFLEALGDDAEVGLYAAAGTVAHALVLVQTTIVGLVAPIAGPAIEAGNEASRVTFRRSQLVLLSMLVPLAVVLAVAGRPILGSFGPGYAAADGVLLLLIIGNASWASAALASLWLQYQGQGRTVLAISMAALVADSAANAVLIPRFGMTGAAAGTAATMTLAAVALFVAWRKGPAARPSGTAAPS